MTRVHVYLGVFVTAVREKKEQLKEVLGCEKCKTASYFDNYCSDCGGKHKRYKRKVMTYPSIKADSTFALFMLPDAVDENTYAYIPDHPNKKDFLQYRWDDDEGNDMISLNGENMHADIEVFEKHYADDLEVLRKYCKDVKIHFGMLTYHY